MRIELDGVGIVRDSAIELDGVTVITGKNNSGKTTIGKALYSVLDACSDIHQKAEQDKINLIWDNCDDFRYLVPSIYNVLQLVSKEKRQKENYPNSLFPGTPTIAGLSLSRARYSVEWGLPEWVEYQHRLLDEIKVFDFEAFFERALGGTDISKESSIRRSLNADFEKQKKQAIAQMEDVDKELDEDPDLSSYSRLSVSEMLKMEFCGQVQSAAHPEIPAEISLFGDDGEKLSHIFTRDNEIDVNNFYCDLSSLRTFRPLFVDDPYIIDRMDRQEAFRRRSILENEDPVANEIPYLKYHQFLSPGQKLQRIFRFASDSSILRKALNEEKMKPLLEQIDRVLPGEFEFSSNGYYYISNGVRLRATNLATGSKVMAIIKQLLETGNLGANTVLILDEPESHLHPEWQNALAEIIIMIAQDTGTKVLLTTHSFYFLLAMEANMRKYGFGKRMNFYQTQVAGNGFVTYQRMNDDIAPMYDDFVQYLIQSRDLRNQYLKGLGDDSEES